MRPTGPISDAGIEAMRAIMAHPRQTMLGLDFDGTLAPIIDDPEQAYADQAAVGALAALGPLVGSIVVITGRPAGRRCDSAASPGGAGLESMVVLGQYGVERWDADSGRVRPCRPSPRGHRPRATRSCPACSSSLGLSDARIEHKGRAIGVHTRELPDPGAAFEHAGSQPLTELAERHGLQLEPGKNVLEIRAHGIDKGDALRAIVAETGVRQVIFAGDDLGDLPAFRAVQRAARRGDRRPAGLLRLARGGRPDRDLRPGPRRAEPGWPSGSTGWPGAWRRSRKPGPENAARSRDELRGCCSDLGGGRYRKRTLRRPGPGPGWQRLG